MAEKKGYSPAEQRLAMLERQKKRDGDPIWKEMVPVFIPRDKKKGSHLFVGINGRTFQVKRGEQVMVPKPVAEVVNTSMEADNAVQDLIDRLKERSK